MRKSEAGSPIAAPFTAIPSRYERRCGASIAARLAAGLFGGFQPRRGETILRDFAQPGDQSGHLVRKADQRRLSPVVALVHVEPAIDLDLQRVAAKLRMAVVPGGEAPGIRRIDRHREPS